MPLRTRIIRAVALTAVLIALAGERRSLAQDAPCNQWDNVAKFFDQVPPHPIKDIPADLSYPQPDYVQGPASFQIDRVNALGQWNLAIERTRAVVQPNWPSSSSVNLSGLATKVKEFYESKVLERVPAVNWTGITWKDYVFVYPDNEITDALRRLTGVKQSLTRVNVRRILLRFRTRFDDPHSQRCVAAYYANYDVNVGSAKQKVFFQINGHCFPNPSGIAFGTQPSAASQCHESTALLAVLGFPVLTYDDVTTGPSVATESYQESGAESPDSLPLLTLRAVDELLLSHFDQIDALGLSGGTERLLHFLLLHSDDTRRSNSWYNSAAAEWRRPNCGGSPRCNLRSAYLAGVAQSRWAHLDGVKYPGKPFGFDRDTADSIFDQSFQYADLALFGVASGVRLGISRNEADDGTNQWFYVNELLPTMRKFTKDFHVGGNDPEGRGPQPGDHYRRGILGNRMAHEYDWEDYFKFITRSTNPMP